MPTKVRLYLPDLSTKCPLPYSEEGVCAGFPSPAENYMTDSIDLNKVLIKNPETTFFARAYGDSMEEANIHEGDLLIVDRSILPVNNYIVVAYINGDFVLKRVFVPESKDCLYLMPENKKYQPIKVTEDTPLTIWGVVTYNVKNQIPGRIRNDWNS